MNFFIFVATCDPRMKICVFLFKDCFVLCVSALPECMFVCTVYMYMCVQCLLRQKREGSVNCLFVCRPVGARNQPWFLCNNHDLNCCSLSSPDLCLSFFFLSFALFSFLSFLSFFLLNNFLSLWIT